ETDAASPSISRTMTEALIGFAAVFVLALLPLARLVWGAFAGALGANPADLVAILQALKAAGALRAELEVI
ncbi:MAG: flagellar basal body P-ring protein FlgI, partial [Burkholderiaceae bacterium]|nr:flagellar basal body P-ring protein FlgI [Burkholderiaceae bacterium]